MGEGSRETVAYCADTETISIASSTLYSPGMYLNNSTMIGLLRKKPQHGGMPGYGGGGNHGHYDHEVYSEEDEESFFSDGEENADDNEQSQYSDEEEEDASQYSEYYDEESIDPELLCPTCNTQTHEYVLKGTILKKWKRMPVEDPHVVDESTGECVTCRVAKLKHDLLDDLPVLPDKWLPASQKQKQQQDQPPPPAAAKSTPVVSNRKSSSSISSFSTGTSRSSKQQDEEESVSLFDEVSHGVSSFSCGLSRASGRMAPLLEVPEREDTSFEESSDESEEESLTTEKDKDKLNKNLIAKDEEEATFEDATKRTPTVFSGQTELFQDFLNDHAASPFKKDAAPGVETVSADRQPQEHAAAAAAAVGSASTSVPNGAADTSVVVSDVLEHYIEEKDFNSTKKKMAEMGRSFRGIFAGRKNKNGDKKEVESEEEVDKGKEEEEVKVKEVGKEIKEKDQDPPPVAALVQPKSELVLAQQWYQEEDKQVPPASSPAPAPAPIAPVPVPITPTEEKDPQEFYDEAAAAVAAAATASKPSEKNKKKLPYIFHRNSKKKKESAKDKATEKEGINQNEVKIPKIIGGDVSFGFPDLLPEDNQVSSSSKLVRDQEDQLLSRNNAVKVEANHDLPIEALKTGITKDDKVNHGPSAPPNVSTDATKKDDKPTKKFGMKKLGITKKKSKKESPPTGGKTAEEMVEEPDNPFLPPNVSPVFKSNAAKAAAPKQRSSLAIAAAPIFASFPDNLLSTVPEDEPDNSPPPPVLEIATGPDEDDDIPNPNTTDVAHLIKGLRTIKDDPRLARKFLVSLRTMSIHHPNRVGIAEAGGIQAIVTCMSRFKRESAVAKQGCAVLQNLVCADCNEHRCAEEGGLDAIVRAMMTHIRSPGTQEHGAAALRNLTAGSLINRTAVAEAGGIEAVVKAMKVHPRSVVVQEKGCAALGNLCIKHAANRVDVGKAGGIHVVVQALARHGYKSRGVSEKGIRCLLNLSYAPSNIEMLKWEAGIEGLVLGVAHRHGGRCKEWALKIFLKM